MASEFLYTTGDLKHAFLSDSDHNSKLMKGEAPIAVQGDRPTQGSFDTFSLKPIFIKEKKC